MAKLKAPQGASGVSYMGEFYKANKKGFITIPGAVDAEVFAAHGYTVVSEDADDAAADAVASDGSADAANLLADVPGYSADADAVADGEGVSVEGAE